MLGLGANIAAVTSTDLFTLSNGQSIDFDGTDDFVEIILNNDIINKQKGTIAVWFRLDDMGGSSSVIELYNEADVLAGTSSNIIQLFAPFNLSTNVPRTKGILFQILATEDGTRYHQQTNAKNNPEHWGTGASRDKETYGFNDSTSSNARLFYNDDNGTFRKENRDFNLFSYAGLIAADSFSNTESQVESVAGNQNTGWIQVTCTWDTTEVFTPTQANNNGAFVTASEITGAMQIFINGIKFQKGQGLKEGGGISNDEHGVTLGMRSITPSFVFDRIRFACAEGSNGSAGNDMDGHISTVAIWDDVLSDNAVAAAYNSGTLIDLTANSGNYDGSNNLVGYWPVEEGGGTIIEDKSGNSNNGILYNNSAWAADGFGN